MSGDGTNQQDQSALDQLALDTMRQLAAGGNPEAISRDLQVNGFAKDTADAFVRHVAERWQAIAAAPRQNADAYFRVKYPQLRSARSAPSLFTMHGIGTMLWGERDRDRATDTFVKTHCFCVFYLPLLALGAYRVAPAGSGWTLIGKVPISRLARWWNFTMLFGVLAAVGLGIGASVWNSPSAIAARTLARGDKAAAAGNLIGASQLYAEVSRGGTEHAAAARKKCAELIERPEVDALSPAEAIGLFGCVVQLPLSKDQSQAVLHRGLAVAKRQAKENPLAAAGLLCCLVRCSGGEAAGTFAELCNGPWAALPAADTINLFDRAAAMAVFDDAKPKYIAAGVQQCERLAAADLPAAFELLAVFYSHADPATTEDCLKKLTAGPMERATCETCTKAVEIAKRFVDRAGAKLVLNGGIGSIEHHPQADPRQVLALLDQLAALPDADAARLAALRRPLLEKLVAAQPGDVDLCVQLAASLEAEAGGGKTADPTKRIADLLSPLRDKLGTGEGARLLGQALAAQGKYDDAYALLAPYLAEHLGEYHRAEQAYQDSAVQAEKRIISELNRGVAPGFDNEKARRVGENERQAMADEYISRQMREDGGVNAAREELVKHTAIVPAALDLGMVMLQRAQGMKEPARHAELERAEKTFLAIRGTAAEDDPYMLHLGQVYYWLGKQQQGQEEFDKLLAKHSRAADVLYAVAKVLRDLGAMDEARKLLEEAYDKSGDVHQRQSIASLRAITPKNLDDRILWLGRCDATEAGVKSLLAEARGDRAAQQGNDDEAVAAYREAAAVYDKLPSDAVVLNNGALVYLHIFELSGDRLALQRSAQWLERAVALSPSDSIVLSNATDQMLRVAAQDLAGTRLNLRELQMSGQVDALYFLAADQKALDELRRAAHEHAGLRKCLAYMERAAILAPRSQAGMTEALAIYSFLRDRDAMQRLADRAAAAKLDLQAAADDTLKKCQYHDEPAIAAALKARVARFESLTAKLDPKTNGPMYAAAVDTLISLRLALPENEPVDADDLVRIAETAYRAAPSLGAYGALSTALMYRADRKLAARFPEYAAATRGTRRAAGPSYNVALALQRSDALGQAARDDRDVQRAAALSLQRMQAFPESRSAFDWALLAAAKPAQEKLRAECLIPDPMDGVAQAAGASLIPINTSAAFENYWRRRAAGAAAAREPLDQLVKRGLPLPVGLIQ